MKHSILAMMVGALLLTTSCDGDDDVEQNNTSPDASLPRDAVTDGASQTPDASLPGNGGGNGNDGGDAGYGNGGAESGADAGSNTPSATSLLPFKEGNTWTYAVTESGGKTTKVNTIGPLERVGGSGPLAGELAYKVTTKKGALDQTVSWQNVVGNRVVRYREESYHANTGALEADEHWSPARLRVDMTAARTTRDATWTEEYMETKSPVGGMATSSTQKDTWSVDAVEQSVTVPAGTFKAIVLIRAGGANLKTYWFVPGIGKVKETGGQTEELVSYTVAP